MHMCLVHLWFPGNFLLQFEMARNYKFQLTLWDAESNIYCCCCDFHLRLKYACILSSDYASAGVAYQTLFLCNFNLFPNINPSKHDTAVMFPYHVQHIQKIHYPQMWLTSFNIIKDMLVRLNFLTFDSSFSCQTKAIYGFKNIQHSVPEEMQTLVVRLHLEEVSQCYADLSMLACWIHFPSSR